MKENVKVLFFVAVISLLQIGALAQSHFIFIQSENKQPFNAILNTKTYGSSGSGYVIIPQLNSGEHIIEVKSVSAPQILGKYRIVINYNDLGFTLKQQESIWVLENVQSGEILQQWKEKAEEKKNPSGGNGFGDILSQVVNDPKLNRKKEDKNVQTDTAVQKAVAVVNTKTEETETDTLPETNTSGVIKNSEEETKTGLNLVFVDFNSKRNDTVSIVIPLEGSIRTDSAGHELNSTVDATILKAAEKDSVKTDIVINKTGTSSSESVTKDSLLAVTVPAKTIIQEKDSVLPAQKQDSISLQTTVVNINTGSEPVKDSVNNPFHQRETIKQNQDSAFAEKKTVDPVINPNCKSIATNDDFLKLRKKLASQDTEDDMLDAARKAFKLKCYTTEQIKNLGSLFLNDQSRYAFLDAAFPFVFDPGNYPTLESQLIDEYYKRRFRAMLH